MRLFRVSPPNSALLERLSADGRGCSRRRRSVCGGSGTIYLLRRKTAGEGRLIPGRRRRHPKPETRAGRNSDLLLNRAGIWRTYSGRPWRRSSRTLTQAPIRPDHRASIRIGSRGGGPQNSSRSRGRPGMWGRGPEFGHRTRRTGRGGFPASPNRPPPPAARVPGPGDRSAPCVGMPCTPARPARTAPFGSSRTGQARPWHGRLEARAPLLRRARSEDSGITAMSSGASARASAASDGISATQGAHHVAHRLTHHAVAPESDRCARVLRIVERDVGHASRRVGELQAPTGLAARPRSAVRFARARSAAATVPAAASASSAGDQTHDGTPP